MLTRILEPTDGGAEASRVTHVPSLGGWVGNGAFMELGDQV